MSRRMLLIGACLGLAAILATYALRSEPTSVSFEAASTARLESHARYERALERYVTFKFERTPLDQALKQIADKAGVAIHIDARALADSSLTPDVPVTLDVTGATLRSALNRLLSHLDLTWTLKNETLIVTTPEKAANELTLVVYPVRDLVMQQTNRGVVFQYQQLADLIDSVVAPTSSDTVDGAGSIHEFAAAGALVVSQTHDVHAQIALLLATLRKARDAQGIRPGETTTAWRLWPNGMPPMGQGRTATPAQTNPQPGTAGQPQSNAPAANGPGGTVPGSGFY